MFTKLFENPNRSYALIAGVFLLYTSRRNSLRFFWVEFAPLQYFPFYTGKMPFLDFSSIFLLELLRPGGLLLSLKSLSGQRQ